MRLRLYIPLVTSTTGASVLAVHLISGLNLGGGPLRAVILASTFAAGFVTTRRVAGPTLVGLFMASLASVLLHLWTLDMWMSSTELTSGITGPPMLLATVFAGALAATWWGRRLEAATEAVVSGASVLILMLVVQALFGEWPVSVGTTIAALIVGQMLAFVCSDLPIDGPARHELGGAFIGGLVATFILSGSLAGIAGFATTVAIVAAITLATVVGALAMLGFIEALAGGSPRHRAKLPIARLLRRTW